MSAQRARHGRCCHLSLMLRNSFFCYMSPRLLLSTNDGQCRFSSDICKKRIGVDHLPETLKKRQVICKKKKEKNSISNNRPESSAATLQRRVIALLFPARPAPRTCWYAAEVIESIGRSRRDWVYSCPWVFSVFFFFCFLLFLLHFLPSFLLWLCS